MSIGILAYGSLIGDPGGELQSVISRRIDNVQTPFRVEFARKSQRRDCAPTLAPVEKGGAQVNAALLVLDDEIHEAEAKNRLYRRETHNVGRKDIVYRPRPEPGPNHVVIEAISDFQGIRTVLYTKIGANLLGATPERLADLAIESARGAAGEEMRDGITYLREAMDNGIVTPLSVEYARQILTKTGTSTLEEAWRACRSFER